MGVLGVLASPPAAAPASSPSPGLSPTGSTAPASLPPTVPSCRIVSERRKNRDSSPSFDTPTMCGRLEVRRLGGWVSRHAEIRPGELRVFRPAEGGAARQLEMRLPLRRMSLLRAEHEGTLAFSLEPQQHGVPGPLASLQPQQPLVLRACTESEYERWVRSLAVELMRQTPLEALRFLDVLGITQARPPPHPQPRHGHQQHPTVTITVSAPPSLPATLMHAQESQLSSSTLARLVSADPLRSRLQGRSEGGPIPVRERRRVFEGLIAASTRASSISSENLSSARFDPFSRRCGGGPGRARSLLDLRRSPVPSLPDLPRRSTSIRELCRFFEQGPVSVTCSSPAPRPDSPEEVCLNPFLSRRRLQRGQRRLTALRERAAASEEIIWHLQEQMAEIDREQQLLGCRNSKNLTDRFCVLERRLQDEERGLTALQAETTRVLRSVELAAQRLDSALGGMTNSSSACSSWDQASTCSSSGVSSDSG